MKIIYLLSELIPCLLIGYLLGKHKQNLSLKVARPLIRFGVPISLMGILLTVGIDFPLIHSAAMSLVSIGLLMTIRSRIPVLIESIKVFRTQGCLEIAPKHICKSTHVCEGSIWITCLASLIDKCSPPSLGSKSRGAQVFDELVQQGYINIV